MDDRRGYADPMAIRRPKIIISNDDGIEADGIRTLVEILSAWADCRMVAPSGPRSGVGHAVSDAGAIRMQSLGGERFSVDGTPVDCARLALGPGSSLFEDWSEERKRRDLWLISGINHGANLGVDTFVSGTVAAAREAAILGFPTIAISQYVARHRQPDWRACGLRAREVLRGLLGQRPSRGCIYNVNLPHPHDESSSCEIALCAPDPNPLPIRYMQRDDEFRYHGDYHNRPRERGHDVDICFGGRIALSQIPTFAPPSAPSLPSPPSG